MSYPEYAKIHQDGSVETTIPDSDENEEYRISCGFLPVIRNIPSEIPTDKIAVEDTWSVINENAVCSYKLIDAPTEVPQGCLELPDGSLLSVETNSLGEKTLIVE